MKRFGNLYERICEPDNLRLAFWKAQKGKAGKRAIMAFRADLDANLGEIRHAFETGNFRLGDYRFFPIYDPKERVICAAAFRERVMHHAVMNVCEPVFEAYQIFDSYAGRKGKGVDACLSRAAGFCRRYGYYLKLDIHKYFDSIPHDRLKRLLRKRFKDPGVLAFFDSSIDSYEVTPGRGVPIGNLSSQFFANLYLAPLDHRVKEEWRVGGYVRYMDDFVLFSDDPAELKRLREEARRFCGEELGLEWNEPCMNSCGAGLRFLGYVIRGDRIRLSLSSKRRFRAKIAMANRDEDQEKAQALVAFTERADAKGFRRKTIFGASAEGEYRVNRGGSWNNNAENCRSANRNRNTPDNRNNNLGFRVVLSPSSVTGRMPFSEQADAPVAPERDDETKRLHGLVGGADTPVERPQEPPFQGVSLCHR